MSINTVQKYIFSLAEKGFISTEPTSVIMRSGQKRNGTLRYTIHSIQKVVDLYHQRQLRKLELDVAKSHLAAQTTV